MTNKAIKRPRCSMCGNCCKGLVDLTMMPEDHRRWNRQGRLDILGYAWLGTPQGYGDLWIDVETGEELSYCPFLKKVSRSKYICTIQDTKPRACKEFWCEWSYTVGKKGIPFKMHGGWTDKARRLGYEQTWKYNHCRS